MLIILAIAMCLVYQLIELRTDIDQAKVVPLVDLDPLWQGIFLILPVVSCYRRWEDTTDNYMQ